MTSLRAAPIKLSHGECSIPRDLFPDGFPHGKLYDLEDPKTQLSKDEHAMLTGAVRELFELASSHLVTAQEMQSNIPKHARPCFLPLVPALHYISKLEKANHDVFDPVLLEPDRLTVLALLSRTWFTGVF